MPTSPWPPPLDARAAPGAAARDRDARARRPARRSSTRTSVGAAAGVLDRVGERLLDDAVGGEVDAGGQRRGARPRRQRHRQAGRARALDERVEAASVGCGARARPRRRAARRAGGASRRAPRGRCARSARRPRGARAGSRSRIRRAPPACTTITLIECATTSCISRAIRRRSSATARSARAARGAPRRAPPPRAARSASAGAAASRRGRRARTTSDEHGREDDVADRQRSADRAWSTDDPGDQHAPSAGERAAAVAVRAERRRRQRPAA